MIEQILTFSLFLLSAASILLRKIYLENPAIESVKSPSHPALKTRSIKSTKRELTLGVILRFVAILSFSVGSLMLSQKISGILLVITLGALIYFVFIRLSELSPGSSSIAIANMFSPLLIGFLNKTKKQTKSLEKYLLGRQSLKKQSLKQMNKQELLDLLTQQMNLSEGRSIGRGIAGSINMLEICSKQVGEMMLPIEEAHIVDADEQVGPILIDELHKSTKNHFLVKSKEDGIIGFVSLKKLVGLKDGGDVVSVLESDINEANEDDNMLSLLRDFSETESSLYIVKNHKNKTVGVLYTKDILSELTTL